MTITEIKEIVTFLKEQKVQSWNIGGFEGSFHPFAFQDFDLENLKPEGFEDKLQEDLYYSGV